jgi:hypothetical protein
MCADIPRSIQQRNENHTQVDPAMPAGVGPDGRVVVSLCLIEWCRWFDVR